MKRRHLVFSSLIATLLSCSFSHGAVLASYAMTASGDPLTGALNVSPTTVATNVTATTLVNQAGGGPAGSFNYNGGTDRASSWSITVGSSQTTFADAVGAGNYITFSITPAAGYELDLSSITFQVASGSSSSTSNRGFFLASEMLPGNFTSSSTVLSADRTPGGGGTIPVQAATVGNTIPKDYSANLSSLSAFTATRYFRFYLQGPISVSLTFDDIVVNGTVTAVPEPSAALLGSLGVLFLLRRRRESKNFGS